MSNTKDVHSLLWARRLSQESPAKSEGRELIAGTFARVAAQAAGSASDNGSARRNSPLAAIARRSTSLAARLPRPDRDVEHFSSSTAAGGRWAVAAARWRFRFRGDDASGRDGPGRLRQRPGRAGRQRAPGPRGDSGVMTPAARTDRGRCASAPAGNRELEAGNWEPGSGAPAPTLQGSAGTPSHRRPRPGPKKSG